MASTYAISKPNNSSQDAPQDPSKRQWSFSGRDVSDKYVSRESPFDKTMPEGVSKSFLEIDLPKASIYGIAIVGPTITSAGSLKGCNRKTMGVIWNVFTHCYALLFVNFFGQIVLLVELVTFVQDISGGDSILLKINSKNRSGKRLPGTCGSPLPLAYTCLAMFVGSVLGDIFETVALMQWHFLVITEPSHKKFQTAVTESGEVYMTTGLTRNHKIFNSIFILFPKLMIALYLLVYGGAFIALSNTGQDAFLNTLAAYFIVEVDEMLFSICTPQMIKTALDKIPPIRREIGEKFATINVNMPHLLLVFVSGAVWRVHLRYCVDIEELPANYTSLDLD